MRVTQLFPGILAICYLGALSIPRHAWQDPGKIMSLTCSFHLFLSAYKKFTQSLYSSRYTGKLLPQSTLGVPRHV